MVVLAAVLLTSSLRIACIPVMAILSGSGDIKKWRPYLILAVILYFGAQPHITMVVPFIDFNISSYGNISFSLCDVPFQNDIPFPINPMSSFRYPQMR